MYVYRVDSVCMEYAVCVEEVIEALNEVKTANQTAPSDVSLELIAASWKVGIVVMVELFYGALDELGFPSQWFIIIVVAIFNDKCDIVS